MAACTSARRGRRLRQELLSTTQERFRDKKMASRRPVELVFSQWFDRITDAIESKRRLKGWSRAKKEAFIRGDIASLQQLSKRKSHYSKPSPTSS
jgi:predicted GIY-YIG superfamily endonuclease